jgi:hypothetical protein
MSDFLQGFAIPTMADTNSVSHDIDTKKKKKRCR